MPTARYKALRYKAGCSVSCLAQALGLSCGMSSLKQKNAAAVALGRLGGSAGTGNAKARTPEQARKAGKIGASVRWANHVKKTEPAKK